MSSALFIRIIGGVLGGAIGAYLSGHIYEYFNKNQQPLPKIKDQPPPQSYETKYQHAKSFEEILNIQIGEHISNKIETEKSRYEYDNEHGNTFEFKNNNNKESETEILLINDPLYDNNYEDFYQYYISLGREY